MIDSVRPAALSDVEELSAMMAEDYTESGYPFDRHRADSCFRQLIRDPSLGRIWILRRDSQVAGYIVLTFCFCMEYGGREAYVDDLFVRKSFRRSGLGRLAMQTVAEESKRLHLRMLNLEVEPGNINAKRLYSGMGFERNRRELMRLRMPLVGSPLADV